MEKTDVGDLRKASEEIKDLRTALKVAMDANTATRERFEEIALACSEHLKVYADKFAVEIRQIARTAIAETKMPERTNQQARGMER